MKMNQTLKNMRVFIALGAIGFAAIAMIAKDADAPKLKEDTRPLDRSRSGVSYAPALKRVTPSVVTVLSTRTVTFRRMHPFFDDPMFNQFFGIDPRQGRSFKQQNRALGSGVIVSEDGYILTNNHVVDGADPDGVRIKLSNDKTEYKARVVGSDPQTDIAVLKTDAPNLKPITLGDSDSLEVGDVVLAIGNPFGVGQSVTKGIISALGRSSGILGQGGYEDFVQTDAPINQGNSGGALVDVDGRLIGINQSIASVSGANAGVGFAVPVNLARSVLDRIVTDGKVRRGFLGVGFGSVDSDLASELKLPEENGAVVTSVQPNSPAAQAGLKPYDVITAVNGKKITDGPHLRVSIGQLRPKAKVTLTIIRDGKQKSLDVTLGEQPNSSGANLEEEDAKSSDARNNDMLNGLELGNLDSRTREQNNVPENIKGALVVNVSDDSPASTQLKAGDVIIEVNRQTVESVGDVRKLVSESKGSRLLLRVWTRTDDGGFTRVVVINTGKDR